MSSAVIRQLPGGRFLPSGPRIVCLGNPLKETLRVGLARRGLELGVQLGGGTVTASYCLSDGGDGFLEAYREVRGGRRQDVICTGPMGNLIEAPFLLDEDSGTAVIETAQACGLWLIPEHRRRLMEAGTAGVGELIMTALDYGARRFVIGLGGSGTTDGGLGMMSVLHQGLVEGLRIREPLAAKDLASPPRIDVGALRERLANVRLEVFCDVTNPLLGPKGAVKCYARQKGASEKEVEELERMMGRWADTVEESLGRPVRQAEGAGAAGGLGFAFAALGGFLRHGAEGFCDLINLREIVRECDAIVTCEGKFDETSFLGKAPWHAATIAREHGRKAVIACGVADDEAVERAEADGSVRVLAFADGVAPESRNAEAFTRLQLAIRDFVIRGR